MLVLVLVLVIVLLLVLVIEKPMKQDDHEQEHEHDYEGAEGHPRHISFAFPPAPTENDRPPAGRRKPL